MTDVTSCCPGTEHAPSHSVLIPAGRSGHFQPILQTWTPRRREVNHLPTGHEAGEQRSWDGCSHGARTHGPSPPSDAPRERNVNSLDVWSTWVVVRVPLKWSLPWTCFM